ncbi:astacin [Ancylostoma caninum]|uniref:Astacin n=1 Tax=Ancylostoma caninum TaxID=29170 RepID=A0A368G5W8_ANCCA|nr:astacin [Ancylostoma caninum]
MSDVGRKGGEQPLSINGKKCDVELAIRQLGRVLGLHPDLNGTKYDYGSIVHSGPSSDESTGLPTDENYNRTIGSHMISFMDLWLINEEYGCHGEGRYKYGNIVSHQDFKKSRLIF